MTRHIHIKNDAIEIEKLGEVARVDIKDFGVYEQVGKVNIFTYEDGDKSSNIAHVINKILEVL